MPLQFQNQAQIITKPTNNVITSLSCQTKPEKREILLFIWVACIICWEIKNHVRKRQWIFIPKGKVAREVTERIPFLISWALTPFLKINQSQPPLYLLDLQLLIQKCQDTDGEAQSSRYFHLQFWTYLTDKFSALTSKLCPHTCILIKLKVKEKDITCKLN